MPVKEEVAKVKLSGVPVFAEGIRPDLSKVVKPSPFEGTTTTRKDLPNPEDYDVQKAWDTDKDILAFRKTFKEKFGEEPSLDNDPNDYDYKAAIRNGERPKLDKNDGLYHWGSKFKGKDNNRNYVNPNNPNEGSKTPVDGWMETKTGKIVGQKEKPVKSKSSIGDIFSKKQKAEPVQEESAKGFNVISNEKVGETSYFPDNGKKYPKTTQLNDVDYNKPDLSFDDFTIGNIPYHYGENDKEAKFLDAYKKKLPELLTKYSDGQANPEAIKQITKNIRDSRLWNTTWLRDDIVRLNSIDNGISYVRPLEERMKGYGKPISKSEAEAYAERTGDQSIFKKLENPSNDDVVKVYEELLKKEQEEAEDTRENIRKNIYQELGLDYKPKNKK